MDKINRLPDELLVKILSFLPTKVAVSTSILSKRWKFLWMWLPNLDYSVTHESVRDFINKNLPLHRAPIIETLFLELSCFLKPEDIKLWIETAVSRYVHELEITCYLDNPGNFFPSSFYTCNSLVILKLEEVTLMDVPSMVCLPSLKTLQLLNVNYADDEALQQLLSICPVLEDLDVHFFGDDLIQSFTVIVPSLQKLSLFIHEDLYLDGYEIDTPSLKYLKLLDWVNFGHYSSFKNMPMLREAYVDVESSDLKSFIGSFTSVKRLTMCTKDVYGDGFVFNQLEHLKLCICKKDSLNLLVQLLNDSPNLRVLDISMVEDHDYDEVNDMVCWNQPIQVPECTLSSLQNFKWSQYQGRPQDRDIVVYILKNARHLKTATIMADSVGACVSNLEMIKELTLSSRASSTCELVFVDDIGTR